MLQKVKMVMLKAVLFGSIGTLVETSELQRRAFNQAFLEAGLIWSWDVDSYRGLLTKSGGRERIQDFANQCSIDVDVSELHSRKTEIFEKMMTREILPLRQGVASVISYAKHHNLKLGFVTTTSETNVDAVFCALGDQISRANFNFIGNDVIASNPKPSPDIYQIAMSKLHLDAQDCIAIEDTASSMKAALSANIRCIAFPGAFAQGNDFNGASVVTSELSSVQLQDSCE